MINKEVREWLQKVQVGQYTYEDAMYEFVRFSVYLSREEMELIKTKIKESYNL